MSSEIPFPLWGNNAPGALGVGAGHTPTLTVYQPPAEVANGAAIVVCPGGGYGGLADHEAEPVARWLNTLGVTGIVLHYRLGPQYHHPIMLGDAGRAIQAARARAGEWNLDPTRIGILGFSAGGHLASTVATHFDEGDPDAADLIARESSRPDVAVLIYPVITLQEPYTHQGSRNNLLGENADPALIALLSNETQVTPQTPPTFLVHTATDTPVPPENSLLFALALSRAGVPFELHLYERGDHGFGLGGDDPILKTWPARCGEWLAARGFLG